MLRHDRVLFAFTGPFGVRVEVGQSLGMLLLLIVFLSGGDLITSGIFAALLLCTIFLHEMGHAWASLVQGIPVRRVMLHGGGGFCETAPTGQRHEHELIVLMGPLVNLGLWALASLVQWVMFSSIDSTPSSLYVQVGNWFGTFAFLNLALFIFNLIPVQPLDGGKLLHLSLLRFFPSTVAHRLTGWVGLVFAVIWIPTAFVLFALTGWILFFFPSISAHYRMTKGKL